MLVKIDPKRIRMDCNTQSRVEMDESIIAEYAAAMERGDEFPPILVFFNEDDDTHVLADGFHRLHAHLRAKPNDQIQADQRIGTIEDAVWESLGANKSHGLRRSNADKRHAVQMALTHPKGTDLSDRQIAKHVGVHHDTVGNIRRELELSGGIRQIETRLVVRGKQVFQQKVRVPEVVTPKTCALCLNYEADSHECLLDHSVKMPWVPVCVEFEEAPEELPPDEIAPPPTEFNVIDPEKVKRKKKQRNHYGYKSRDTLRVDLPVSDPNLTVVELRHLLGVDYLDACFIAWRTLKTSD